MTLTKQDLAKALTEQLNVGQDDGKAVAKKLVEDFFEEIRCALEKGENVKLSSFGNFELRDKASRPGRNPKTGESVPVSARRVVVFKPGQKLRKRVEKAIPKQ